jgi:hypothetical protein
MTIHLQIISREKGEERRREEGEGRREERREKGEGREGRREKGEGRREKREKREKGEGRREKGGGREAIPTPVEYGLMSSEALMTSGAIQCGVPIKDFRSSRKDGVARQPESFRKREGGGPGRRGGKRGMKGGGG